MFKHLMSEDDPAETQRAEFERRLREKDTQLVEIQHRVKNNLQMITALMRIEALDAVGGANTASFERLAGRIEAVQILYALLLARGQADEIDLGEYLGKIASAVLRSNPVACVRLDLKLDAYTMSAGVAMSTGLVVNELLTNALKHAFVGRDGGTISLHSLADDDECRVIVADDGIGLPTGMVWPEPGRLSALIVQSLQENASASVTIESTPGKGMRATVALAGSPL